MIKKESDFQKAVIKHITTCFKNSWVQHFVTARAGWPDLIGAISGFAFAIELKIGTTYRVTKLQQRKIDLLNKLQTPAIVLVYDKDFPNKWLEELEHFFENELGVSTATTDD